MRSGLAISGSAHSLILVIILANGIFLFPETTHFSSKDMEIYIISAAEFDAEVSVPPSVEIKHDITSQSSFSSLKETILEVSPENEVKEIAKHEVVEMLETDSMDLPILNSLEIELATNDNKEINYQLDSVLPNLNIEKLDEKISKNFNKLGNESQTLTEPTLEKPMERNEDRIDKIASDNKSADSISDSDIPKLVDSIDEVVIKDEERSDEEANKAATTEITPDGAKDVPIVVSGMVLNSVVPPPRKVLEKIEVAHFNENSNELLQSSINNLIEELNKDEEKNTNQKNSEISTMEKLKLRKNIKQLIGRYWNKGILIGGSDFENYVVKVEILLDSKGNIIGDVNPLKPAIPTGRYAVAFREASNAIKAVGRIPIPLEKYKKGLKIKLTFVPGSGIEFD